MDLALWGAAAFAALNLLGFALAAWDKRAAGRGRRRVAERTLLLLALYGAWPGLLLAFLALGHKTRKGRFLAPFALAASANAALLAFALWWARR